KQLSYFVIIIRAFTSVPESRNLVFFRISSGEYRHLPGYRALKQLSYFVIIIRAFTSVPEPLNLVFFRISSGEYRHLSGYRA
ncbi:MAG TPA: hypothetical protein PLG61_05315, partial [Methanoregulaceae archaeon]|nr:hypothetical protein [Methanoregulaceae archaeon]